MDILFYYRRKTMLNEIGSVGVNGQIQYRKPVFSFALNLILNGKKKYVNSTAF